MRNFLQRHINSNKYRTKNRVSNCKYKKGFSMKE